VLNIIEELGYPEVINIWYRAVGVTKSSIDDNYNILLDTIHTNIFISFNYYKNEDNFFEIKGNVYYACLIWNAGSSFNNFISHCKNKCK